MGGQLAAPKERSRMKLLQAQALPLPRRRVRHLGPHQRPRRAQQPRQLDRLHLLHLQRLLHPWRSASLYRSVPSFGRSFFAVLYDVLAWRSTRIAAIACWWFLLFGNGNCLTLSTALGTSPSAGSSNGATYVGLGSNHRSCNSCCCSQEK